MPTAVPFPTSHRPWPVPERRWLMRMVWEDLLFAHWRVDAAALRRVVPAALELDLLDGEAWLAVVPFRMRGVLPRGVPALPFCSAFAELNLRTYVRHRGVPGVWFFSLDAASKIAVRAARAWFRLPYFDARMDVRSGPDDTVHYSSERTHANAPAARLGVSYAPVGPEFAAPTDARIAWLVERYRLYAVDRRGSVLVGEIHHSPWTLRTARADFAIDTMSEQIGLVRHGPPDLLHFAKRLGVVAWAPERAPTEEAR